VLALPHIELRDLLSRRLALIESPPWYAIRTYARHEKQVRDRLARQGIEPLLPTTMRLSQWKDRKKRIEVPLFSVYCFAQFRWADKFAVLSTPEIANTDGLSTYTKKVTNGC